jgi:hypothetical protein
VRVIDGADETGAGTGEATDEAEAAASAPSVDELFARIRAGAEDPADGGAPGAEPVTEAVPEAATQAVEAVDVVVVEPVEGADDAPPPGPDDPLIAQRDELLGPVTARLSRAVKRALGDDQNRLLDRIRSTPALAGDVLLGPEEEHRAVFAQAVRAQLGEAYAAGTVFGGAPGAGAPDDGTVEESTTGLAHVVVTMLRRQIEDDGGDLGDQVSAAYREWRGERVQRVCGDYATQAFSAGVVAAGADQKLRWIVTSATGCSDCEDNALAGAVSAREAFPTGHAHPPAHSGCRCLVAPTSD